MRTVSLGALVLLSVSFAVAIGDETAILTVKNLTARNVIVVVDNKTLPTVSGGSQVTYQTSGPATVSVKASYAPGQGVQGSALRQFHLAPYQAGTQTGGTAYFACVVGGPIIAPATGGPIMWKVTPDTLAVP
jgi:hypothetical protein